MRSSMSNFSTEKHKNLASGLHAGASLKSSSNIMMDAIVVAKKSEDQKKELDNRIKRLQMEEERANKRIKDL